MTIALDTNVEYSSKENWMTDTVVHEHEQFYQHFPSKEKDQTSTQDIIFLVLLRVRSYFKHWVKEQNLFR